MPTYEAQRALPPNEGTIKESWLAHQRREWQRNVSARRRYGSLHSAASFTGSVRSEGSGGDSPRGSVVRVEDITILRLR